MSKTRVFKRASYEHSRAIISSQYVLIYTKEKCHKLADLYARVWSVIDGKRSIHAISEAIHIQEELVVISIERLRARGLVEEVKCAERS